MRYLIAVIVVNFSVKSHEMNKAHIHTPPTKKTTFTEFIEQFSIEYPKPEPK